MHKALQVRCLIAGSEIRFANLKRIAETYNLVGASLNPATTSTQMGCTFSLNPTEVSPIAKRLFPTRHHDVNCQCLWTI